MKVENLSGTIKTHITSNRHKDRLVAWIEKNADDREVKEFLHEHFREHPNEEASTVSDDVMEYRWRVVESCMHGGIPINKIANLRPLLERGNRPGHCLTDSSHLRSYIPKIEEFEHRRLLQEIKGQSCCVIFDGTCRLGECISVLLRWCRSDFSATEQRLVALRTTKTHMDGDQLGALLVTVLLGGCQLAASDIVCLARDSCATNGKAYNNIRSVLIEAESIMCLSHTLSHCGEHVKLPVLDEFMTPWLSLVEHHPTARTLWKAHTKSAMKGFSTTRWCSREEVSNEIATNFGVLKGYIDTLVEEEVGDKHTKKLKEIVDTKATALELELACNLDLQPIISTCYTLEGDGLVILLARDMIDSLLGKRESIGKTTESMRNVAALLWQKAELKVGTPIYELFSDVTPAKYFKGKITATY